MNDVVEQYRGDTGTVYHIINSLDCIRDVEPCSITVKGIEGNDFVAEAVGTLTVVFVNNDRKCTAYTNGVMYLPKLGYYLLSPNAGFERENLESHW